MKTMLMVESTPSSLGDQWLE